MTKPRTSADWIFRLGIVGCCAGYVVAADAFLTEGRASGIAAAFWVGHSALLFALWVREVKRRQRAERERAEIEEAAAVLGRAVAPMAYWLATMGRRPWEPSAETVTRH